MDEIPQFQVRRENLTEVIKRVLDGKFEELDIDGDGYVFVKSTELPPIDLLEKL